MPQGEFGLDVLALVGQLRYREQRSVPQIHQALQARGVQIAARSVTELLHRYEELVALRLGDAARLRTQLAEQGGVILVLDAWAYAQHVTLDFIEPGKPTQNAYRESFNGKFRDECLNAHWFVSLAQARQIIGVWKEDYNTQRPHGALKQLSPAIYAQTISV